MAYEQAIYHLGYELDGETPVISLHTDPAHLENLAEKQDGLEKLQEYLGIEAPFAFDSERYGYAGVGNTRASDYVVGWTALKLALPKAHSNERSLGAPTPRLLPVVATLSTALSHLNRLDKANSSDPNHPQLVVASLNNRVPLNEHYSAPLRAHLSPALLERLAAVSDIGAAEERVRDALLASFQYPYGQPVREYAFRVSLGDDIAFDYPGDGTGFFASRAHKALTEGLTLDAANNDYPLQQIAIVSGLAALNDVALGR